MFRHSFISLIIYLLLKSLSSDRRKPLIALNLLYFRVNFLYGCHRRLYIALQIIKTCCVFFQPLFQEGCKGSRSRLSATFLDPLKQAVFLLGQSPKRFQPRIWLQSSHLVRVCPTLLFPFTMSYRACL